MKKRTSGIAGSSVLLVVSWGILVVAAVSAARFPPSEPTVEQIPDTASVKNTLIQEYDAGVSSTTPKPIAQLTREYWKREITCLVVALLAAIATFRSGFFLSESTGRHGVSGGLLALLTGPLYFALLFRPK